MWWAAAVVGLLVAGAPVGLWLVRRDRSWQGCRPDRDVPARRIPGQRGASE